jgi:HEAT repeat protein
MSAKIAYAQRRWGCTLFYVDSNTFSDSWLSTAQQKEKRGVPRIMPVAMVQELHRRHPDCLIIPEHSDQLLYYTCCAPYSHFSLTGTDLLRRLWPAAFRTVVWDRDLLATRMGWDACVRQVQEGDILLFQAFRDAPENELVRWIYREAGYRRRGQADSLARAKPSTLAKKAGDPGEATRFAVASALGQRPETWNPTILASLLDDASPLVRQRTLLTLAQGQTFNDPALITRLGSWLQEAPSPCDDFLRPFAADALARAGGAAVPLLTDLLRQNKPGQAPSTWPLALRALGQTGARTEEVTRSVLAFLDAQPPDPRAEQRRAAIEAAGLLRLPSAVPSLTNLLRTSAGDETVDQAVIIALGRIGERSSVEDLLKYWEATHRHTATRNALNEALAAITGQNEVWNAEEWRRWWTTGGDSP